MMKRPTLNERPIVLSIGTTEPLVSAGVLLDILMADRLEIRPLAVVTAVSAQNGRGQFKLEVLSAAIVQAQLESYHEISIAAIRLGAMPSRAIMDTVAKFLIDHQVPVVLDPVIATSAGGILLEDDVIDSMVERIFPYVTTITPNLYEAEILAGHKVTTIGEMDAAALAIQSRGARTVLLKGGHLNGAPIDVLWDGVDLRHYESARIVGDMRGTGCILALAMTAAFAHGHDLRNAVRVGRELVRLLIPNARQLGGVRVTP